MVLPMNFWLLFAAAMLISSIGFKNYVWFISLGYGFSIAVEGLLMLFSYGKNLTFKTGGVDGCDCEETLRLIAEGKLNTEPLITHTYPLSKIEEAYELFENREDGVIKVAIEC